MLIVEVEYFASFVVVVVVVVVVVAAVVVASVVVEHQEKIGSVPHCSCFGLSGYWVLDCAPRYYCCLPWFQIHVIKQSSFDPN